MLLYYITDRTQFSGEERARRRALSQKIADAARCRIDFIQLREKDLSARELEILARAAVRTIREYSSSQKSGNLGTRLLINSRTDVAIACGADGVHLRSDDISAVDVRRIWRCGAGAPSTSSGQALAREPEGSSPIIGVSCHSSEDVARAASDGADFAIFAPVFEKKDTPGAGPLGIAGLQEACRQNIPVLALGGVTLANARGCLEAGAAGIAGIRLFQENDIAEVVRKLRV